MKIPHAPSIQRWANDGVLPKDDWPDVVELDGTKRLIRVGEWILSIPAGGYMVLSDRQVAALMEDEDAGQ